MRLAAYFGNDLEFWFTLQNSYKLDMAKYSSMRKEILARMHPVAVSAKAVLMFSST